MAGTIVDLSGNGKGVLLSGGAGAIAFTVADVVIPARIDYMRVQGAGNVTVRSPGSSVDTVIAAKDGEYIPVISGTIIRKTGTTVTALTALSRGD